MNTFEDDEISIHETFNISKCFAPCLHSKQIGFFTINNQKCIIWNKSIYVAYKTQLYNYNTFCVTTSTNTWCATEKYWFGAGNHYYDYCKKEECNVVKIDHDCLVASGVIATSSSLTIDSTFFCKDQHCIIVLFSDQNTCFFRAICSRNCQQLENYRISFFPNCKVLRDLYELNNIRTLSPLTQNTLYNLHIIPILNERTIGKVTKITLRTKPLNIRDPDGIKLLSRTSSSIEIRLEIPKEQDVPSNIYTFKIKSLNGRGTITVQKKNNIFNNLNHCEKYCFRLYRYYYSQQSYESPIQCFYTLPGTTVIEEVRVINNTVKWSLKHTSNCSIMFEGEYFMSSNITKYLTFSTSTQEIYLYNLVPKMNYSVRLRMCLRIEYKCNYYGEFTPWLKFDSKSYIKGQYKNFVIFILLLLLLTSFAIVSYCKRGRIRGIIEEIFIKKTQTKIISMSNLKDLNSMERTSKVSLWSFEENLDNSLHDDSLSMTMSSVEVFENYYEKQIKNNNILLKMEYKKLGKISKKYQSLNNLSVSVGKMDFNAVKNRYINILPYDHNMVVLKGRSANDNYINASYIPYETNSQNIEYIACQGPIYTTVADFWKMLWDENISCIIMLTECYEDENLKCVQYWPKTVNSSSEYNCDFKMVIYLQEEINYKEYIERKMIARNDDTEEERIIIHLQMVSWNDHSIPNLNSFEAFLLHFHKLCIEVVKAPYLFHCSAGVGRTGTFMVIDRIIKKLVAGSQEIDIFNEVLTLRKLRMQIVQQQSQYIFIYMFIKYFITKYVKLNQQHSEKMNIYNND